MAAYVASLHRAVAARSTACAAAAPPSSRPERLGRDSQAERPYCQPIDRAYGGSIDFLETNVTTGSRGGAGAGSAAAGKDEAEKLGTSLGVLCDEFGIHFRF